jgi:DNA-binding protein H-NS
MEMTTYSAIKEQIARLEKQAEALRKTEVAGVIARIKEAIKTYGLTAADLGLGRGAVKIGWASEAKPDKKTSTTIGVPKYHDPKSGKTWTGRGTPPAWIAGAKNRDAYLIEGKVSGKPAAQGATRTNVTAKSARAKRKARAARKTRLPAAKMPKVHGDAVT